jgi:hypothetical protein
MAVKVLLSDCEVSIIHQFFILGVTSVTGPRKRWFLQLCAILYPLDKKRIDRRIRNEKSQTSPDIIETIESSFKNGHQNQALQHLCERLLSPIPIATPLSPPILTASRPPPLSTPNPPSPLPTPTIPFAPDTANLPSLSPAWVVELARSRLRQSPSPTRYLISRTPKPQTLPQLPRNQSRIYDIESLWSFPSNADLERESSPQLPPLPLGSTYEPALGIHHKPSRHTKRSINSPFQLRQEHQIAFIPTPPQTNLPKKTFNIATEQEDRNHTIKRKLEPCRSEGTLFQSFLTPTSPPIKRIYTKRLYTKSPNGTPKPSKPKRSARPSTPPLTPIPLKTGNMATNTLEKRRGTCTHRPHTSMLQSRDKMQTCTLK